MDSLDAMGYLRLDGYDKIEMPDSGLDVVVERLEEASRTGEGFFLDMALRRSRVTERSGVRTKTENMPPDLDSGHQRIWVHPSHCISFVYDRPRASDPRMA